MLNYTVQIGIMKNIGRVEGVQVHTVANVGNLEVQKEKNQDIMIRKVVVTVNIGDNSNSVLGGKIY